MHALFDACETAAPAPACRDALDNMGNPYWISDQPAGTEVSGWLDAWAAAPSVYALEARDAADIAAGVAFAREHDLRVVVKGTGHSYLGTSNASDSLLIWTHAMRRVTLHDTFVGQGCAGRVASVPAVTAESGAVWMDLYNAVTTEAGRYVQGGGCTTVGVAGLVQSGGFGSFSKGFGMAASSLLEAEIVTADGEIRVVNECLEPDLFWALKGGGGGTFGVVTRLTLRTHDLPSAFGSAGGTIEARSDAAFRQLLSRVIAFYHDNLVNPHWGEQIRVGAGNTLQISMVNQGLDTGGVRAIWKPFFDWVNAAPDDYSVTSPFYARAGDARTWWKVEGNAAMIPDTRPNAPARRGWWRGDQAQVGGFIHGYESLWLPASLLQPNRQTELTDTLFAASRYKRVELHSNKGLAGATEEARAAARQTAINPAAIGAFALAIIADGEAPAYPGLPGRSGVDLNAARQSARAIDAAAEELRKVAPDSGSYVSESNYFNPAWQSAYWGRHYARLKAIKTRYDPEGLFWVHHGVGSEDWSADGFERVDP